jgi:hypothetical protein
VAESTGRGSVFSYGHYGLLPHIRQLCLLLQERLLISSETQAVLDAERREDANVKAILEQEVRSLLLFQTNLILLKLMDDLQQGHYSATLHLSLPA